MAGIDITRALTQAEDSIQLLFAHKIANIRAGLAAIRSHTDQLLSAFGTHVPAEAQPANGSLDIVQVYNLTASGATTSRSHFGSPNVGQQLGHVNTGVGALLDALAQLPRQRRSAGYLSAYMSYGSQLRDAVVESSRRRNEADESAAKAAESVEVAQLAADTASSSARTSGEARTAAAEAAEATRKAQSEADGALTQIRETARQASSLQVQVDEYAGRFDGFKASLESMLAAQAQFKDEAERASQRNAERETEIDTLATNADLMIQGATTAGLAKSLDDTRKAYVWKARRAQAGFLVAIVLLAASAIPLVAHMLPGLFPATWAPAQPTTSTVEQAWMSLIGKLMLLAPATWLARFFAKANAEAFHLEREYAHKAALAQSVEGFKRQAKGYESDIAAAVFEEVRSNPSKQKAPDPADHPLWAMLSERVAKRMAEMVSRAEAKESGSKSNQSS